MHDFVSRSRKRRHRGLCGVLVLALALASPTLADEGLFAVSEIEGPGRAAQADLVDLDGDGLGDLIWISIDAIPPDERREIRVHYQRPGGEFRKVPDWVGPLPSGAAAYDLADADDRPGVDLLLLRRTGITRVGFGGREMLQTHLPVPGGATIAVVYDERGLDRFRLARPGLGPSLRLVAPQLGTTTLLETSGEVVAQLDVGARANFFVPPRPGPVVAESEIEIYFDHPRIDVGDVNGDGRGDVVSSNRHGLRVFLQAADGSFPSAPSFEHDFRLLASEDHIRSVGSVRLHPEDLDGDGRLDLLVSRSKGSLLSASTDLLVHLNRDGRWNFAKPDQEFHTESGLTTSQIVDLDGDGHMELVDIRVPTGVLEIVEVLLTRALDIEVKIRRAGSQLPFQRDPWLSRKFDLSISFETFRGAGFVPTLNVDFNGDRRLDLVGSANGDALEIWVGEEERGFAGSPVRQTLRTSGRIRFGDVDADGLTDFVIYDPRVPRSPILIGINRGVLPGTVRAPALAPTPEGAE